VRLAALVEHEDHVCCRYRLRAFEPYMRAAGHELTYVSLDSAWLLQPSVWRALHQADAVVLQRRLLSAPQRFLLRSCARRLLYDIDDAVFLRDSYSPRGLTSARRARRFHGLAHQADVVVAGNAFLAARSRSAGAGQVAIVPTCVDPERYHVAEHGRKDSGVQMVWIGSASTLQGLERLGPVLNRLGQTWVGLSLKLVCNRFLHLPHLPVIPCHWQEQREAGELAAADIGISFVPDDDWSRGKCGLKILQYMAAGLPVVANPVGVHCDMIVDGVTGFLVDTPAAWIEAVGRLLHSPDLRRRMGHAGRRRVETHFSVQVGAARWLDLLQGFKEKKQAA
jgi:glycosyltransferase involved in cell wall biosynthesis